MAAATHTAPSSHRTRARDHPHQLLDDRARHLNRHHRAPEDLLRLQFLRHRTSPGSRTPIRSPLVDCSCSAPVPATFLGGAGCSWSDWQSSLPHRSPSVWHSRPIAGRLRRDPCPIDARNADGWRVGIFINLPIGDARDLLAHGVAISLIAGTTMFALALALVFVLIVQPAHVPRAVSPAKKSAIDEVSLLVTPSTGNKCRNANSA